MSKNEKVALADFNWDNDDNFFQEAKEEVKEAPKQEAEEVEETEEEVENKEEKEENLDFSFGEPEFDSTEESEDSNYYKSVYEQMKSQGIFSVELEEGEELNEETFADLQDREIESRLEEALSDFVGSLDDEAKAFIKFKKEGGDTKQFFKLYGTISEAPTPEIGDDMSHERFLKYYYSTYENMDVDEVEDKIDWLKEKGKLESYSLRFSDKIEQSQIKEKERIVKEQQEIAKQNEEKRKVFSNDLKNTIHDAEAIKDWPVTPKDKKELHRYMTKAAVKIGPNQYLTQLQSDLQEAFKDKEKLILIAKLLKDDFNIDYLKKSAITEETKKTKEKLSNTKVKKRSSGNASRNRSLADFFN